MRGRWDDWVAMAAGIGAAVSWAWHGMLGLGMVLMFLSGVLTVFAAMLSTTRPGMRQSEAAVLGLGLLMCCLPWLVGFTGVPAAAWTAWGLGGVIAVMGGIGLMRSGTAPRGLVVH